MDETRFPKEYKGIKALERGGEESRETKMEKRRGREKKEREKRKTSDRGFHLEDFTTY